MPTSSTGICRIVVAKKLWAGGLCIALAACSTTPRPSSLDRAEVEVAAVRGDTQAQRFATDELAKAELALTRAEQAWRGGAEKNEIDHLAYLAQRRADITAMAAKEEQTKETIEALSTQQERIRLEARAREARIAERRAEKAESEVARMRREARERAAELAKQRAEKAEAELKRLEEELKAERTERGLVLTLGDILFDVDRAQLKPGGVLQLKRVAAFLRENPDRKLLIEGHTDSTGEEKYNLDLSQRRASAVENYFRSQGIDPTRVVSRGYGEQFPVTTNKTSAGRQQNRRVEIVILDEDKPLPPPRLSRR